MELETPVAPDAATQNPAPESAVTPEIATPEAEASTTPEEKPEDDQRDKSLRRLERRVNQKHAQAAAAEERARMVSQELESTRQRLAQYETPQEPQQHQPDPYQLAEVISTVKEVNRKADQVAADGKSRFKDFEGALKEVFQEVGPLFDQRRNGLPTPIGEAILECADPAAVLYHLGTNQDVAAELRGLTPIQAARKLARIEAQIEAQTAAAKEPKQSTAPKPITPVKSAMRNDGGLTDDLSTEEWIKRRNQQVRGK